MKKNVPETSNIVKISKSYEKISSIYKKNMQLRAQLDTAQYFKNIRKMTHSLAKK
jgi:hypothetical protein